MSSGKGTSMTNIQVSGKYRDVVNTVKIIHSGRLPDFLKSSTTFSRVVAFLRFCFDFDVFNSEIEKFLIIQSSFFNLQLAQSYPRIDKGVKNIEGQIDEYVNQPEKETNAH